MTPPKKRMFIALSVAVIGAIIFSVFGLPLAGFSFNDALAQVYGEPEAPCGATDGRVNNCQPWQTAALYCRADGAVEALYAVHLTPLEGSRLFWVTGEEIAAAALLDTPSLLATDVYGFGFQLWYFPGAEYPFLLIGPGLGVMPYIFAFNCGG